MRSLLLFILLALLPAAHAQHDYAREEFVIVSGGPALREWEDYRVGADQHDRYAGNFIKAAHHRMMQMRRSHGEGARITWLVYRPGYETREREDNRRRPPFVCPVSEINSRAANVRARLVWFNSRDFLINYLNQRGGGKLGGFEFFGHSNKYAFLFDYGNDVLGASTSFLHSKDLVRLRSGIFAPGALAKSWGCHTAEYMSRYFKKATGQPLIGAIGKTDYRAISDNKSLPTVGGRWGQ